VMRFGTSTCRGWGVAAGLVLVLLAGTAEACSVPVFRYALERWPADPYEVLIFHRGDLSEEQQQALDHLKKASVEERPDGVVDLWIVDLSQGEPKDEAAEIWKAHAASAKTPWVVVRYPRMFGIPIDMWAGPLGEAEMERLLDSPTRRQVAKSLLEGETTVFVLLESGNAKQDEAAAKRLEKTLRRLEKEIEPPVPPGGMWGDPIYDTEGAPQLKIAFSVVRVSRDDPAESGFRHMLLGCEPGLKKETEPMVFPMFGRGRVLCALVGEGIAEENIEEICWFVSSACSCIVKYQNPGVDMLMDVRWDAALMGEPSAIPEVKPPPLTGLAKFVQAAEAAEAEKEGGGADAGESAPAPGPEVKTGQGQPSEASGVLGLAGNPVFAGVAAGLAGLVIVALVSVVLWKRSKGAEA